MADFVVDIPIDSKGGTGSSSSNKESKETNRLLKKLDSSVLKTIDIYELGMQLFAGLIKLLQPLLQVLNVLFFIIFLPLLPLIKSLTQAVVGIIQGLMKLFGGEISFMDFLSQYVLPALLQVIVTIGKLLWEGFVGFLGIIGEVQGLIWDAFVWLGEKIFEIGEWLVEKFMEGLDTAFQVIMNFGAWLWEIIKIPFEWLGDVGSWIWDQIIKPAFEWLSDVGSKIWDVIKPPFEWLADKISGIWSWFKGGGGGSSEDDFLMRPGQSPVSFSPDDTIVGMKDIGKLGGGMSIVINNPVIREENDIKKLTDLIARRLQSNGNRQFS